MLKFSANLRVNRPVMRPQIHQQFACLPELIESEIQEEHRG